MADRLNVVPIGIENESGVVVRVVVRAKARGSIVLAARRWYRLLQLPFATDPEIRLSSRCPAPDPSGSDILLVVVTSEAQQRQQSEP
jgi:hypothetical protein